MCLGPFDLSSIRAVITEVVAPINVAIERQNGAIERLEMEAYSSTMCISSTNVDAGETLWQNCPNKRDGVEACSAKLSTPLLTEVALQQLKATYMSEELKKEDLLVALMTPCLMDLVSGLRAPKVIANSEQIGWIRTNSPDVRRHYRPDMFVCDPVAFVKCEAPEQSPKSNAAAYRSENFLFGSCAWPLRNSLLCLFEAKVKISLKENLGSIHPKVQFILRPDRQNAPQFLKVCLFDLDTMYLLVYTFVGLSSSHKVKLTDAGSREVISDFILPPHHVEPFWLCTLHKLCLQFAVTPVVGNSFLGSGQHGKVFQVKPNQPVSESAFSADLAGAGHLDFARHLALKMVEGVHTADLFKEQRLVSLMVKKHAVLPSYVSKLSSVIDGVGQSAGCGMILQPVGEPVCRPPFANAKTLLFEVLNALLALHQEVGTVHGDARLENLIRVDGKLVWIDFRECQDATSEVQRWRDVVTFLKNFSLHHKRLGMEFDDFNALRTMYDPDEQTQFESFKDAVWDVVNSART